MRKANTWLAAVAVFGLMAGCGAPMADETQAPATDPAGVPDSNVSAQACEDNPTCFCNKICRQQCGSTNQACIDECVADCL